MIRMAFAVLSSVHTPACISLIGDYFDHENRSKANSVYVTAVSFGVGLANLTTIMNEQEGWRNSILIVSGIGLGCGMLGLTIEEALRSNDRGNEFLLTKELITKRPSLSLPNVKLRTSYSMDEQRISLI
jgi:MFS family permease